VLTQTDYAYDAHGRLRQTIDARNGATTYTYNCADLVATNTTPAPAPAVTPCHVGAGSKRERIVRSKRE